MSGTSTTPTTVTLSPASGSATLGTDTSSSAAGLFRRWCHLGPHRRYHGLGARRLRGLHRPCATTNDIISEPSENITLGAATPQNVAPVVGTGTIIDNDGTPSLSVNDVSVNEAAGTATFTVTLSNPSASTVTVGYNTSNGSAVAGSDFTSASGSLTFNPGVTSQTITVSITDDNVFELAETFNVNLVTPTNATIADALAWARSVTMARAWAAPTMTRRRSLSPAPRCWRAPASPCSRSPCPTRLPPHDREPGPGQWHGHQRLGFHAGT